MTMVAASAMASTLDAGVGRAQPEAPSRHKSEHKLYLPKRHLKLESGAA